MLLFSSPEQYWDYKTLRRNATKPPKVDTPCMHAYQAPMGQPAPSCSGAHLDTRTAAAQLHRLVQQLGHLLIVGVVLALGPALNVPVVLQLRRRLLGEALRGGGQSLNNL